MGTGLHPTPGLTELLGRVISHPRLPPRCPLQAGALPFLLASGQTAARRTRSLPLSAPAAQPTLPPKGRSPSSAHAGPFALLSATPAYSLSPAPLPSRLPPACGTLPCGSGLGSRPLQASWPLTSPSFAPLPPSARPLAFLSPSSLRPAGLLPEEILTPTLYHGYYVRPRAAPAGEGSRAGASELRLSEGKFQAFLDVSHFTPDEVTVRTVDNLLEVSARHPQRLDRHGFVSREFCRTYVLPADVDPWRVRAALSHDGILNLEAPRGGRHLDTEVNEVYISLLPAPPDPEEEEEAVGVEP